MSNIGLRYYMNATHEGSLGAHEFEQMEALFQQALALHANNSSAYRGVGFVHWRHEKDLAALEDWRHLDLTAKDYIRFGARAASIAESLRWYGLAETLEPTNAELWLNIGQICQNNRSVGAVCDRFLAHNEFSWLVDPKFAFGQSAWRFNRQEGASYEIVDCPNMAAKKCAMARIDAVTSPHGTSWQQCLTLEPGRQYRFSAWIKAETSEEWRPLYFQGSMNGTPKGFSPKGANTGSLDWAYWAYDLTAPEFDNNRACFHPVRLLGLGQVWFHSPALKPIQ